MKSSTAVLQIPAISTRSSPCIPSPEVVFQQEAYPWAVQTPEGSPRSWGVEPTFSGPPASLPPSPVEARLLDMWAELQSQKTFPQETPVEPLFSRELLRTVCEPFFEQMLMALEQAMMKKQQMFSALDQALREQEQQQKQQEQAFKQKQQGQVASLPREGSCPDRLSSQDWAQTQIGCLPREVVSSAPEGVGSGLESAHAMTQLTRLSAKAAAFQPVFHSRSQHDPMLDEVFHANSQHDGILDEESTEADEHGAFASLLSGPSETESVEADSKSPETSVVAPVAPAEQAGDLEKNAMVCRHWRSKGWCRLQESGCCKFAHPEHKRGIAVPTASNGVGADDDDISKVAHRLSNVISTEGEVPVTKRKKSKKSKKNHGKSKADREEQVQPGSPEQEVARSHAPKEVGIQGNAADLGMVQGMLILEALEHSKTQR